MALNALVSCYTSLNDTRPICDLPCTDYVRVFWTVKSSFANQINDTAAKFETLEAVSCLSNGTSQCSLITKPKHVICEAAFRSSSYLKHYKLKVKLAESFDMSSEVVDNKLAYSIMEAVSSKFKWNVDTTVDWYSLAKGYNAKRSTIEIKVLCRKQV